MHAHGFGVCVYQGRGLQCFHDTQPACTSPIAQLVQQYPMRTLNMMAHIRYATHGAVSLENVHPFSRVWKGIQMCFAHNGDCPKFKQLDDDCSSAGAGMVNKQPILLGQSTCDNIFFYPVGDTDSEAVFCAILNALHAEFPGNVLPTLPVLHEFLSTLCQEIIQQDNDTIFNFLLGCGEYTQFAFSYPGRRPGSQVWNGLHYLVREAPFSTAKLVDEDLTIDFANVTTFSDRVAIIATKPLTGESGWVEMYKGELIMFDKGKPYRSPKCCEIVEQEGRGLSNRWSALKCSTWKRSPSLIGGDAALVETSKPPSSIAAPPTTTAVPLPSSVHAETILTSPGLPSSLDLCNLYESLPEILPCFVYESKKAPSPTTVALASTTDSSQDDTVESENGERGEEETDKDKDDMVGELTMMF